ncbi:MAG: M48 family metallopeptidase [Candidatus Paceibacterota bacterium]
MNKQVILNEKIISYNLKRKNRVKNLILTVGRNGQVGLTVPKYMPIYLAEKFLKEKAEWVLEKIKHFEELKPSLILGGSRKDFLEKKESALALVENRLNYFNKSYNFGINRVIIKNQKTRWGSCSIKKNLNFNYKLVYLPERLVDYVVVHELCHLKEMNHSVRFWALVAAAIPVWKSARKELKNHIF